MPSNSFRKLEQHRGRPHIPIPPMLLERSLAPICFNSILHFKVEDNSFNYSLKSNISSET